MTLEELLNSEMDFESLAALARQGLSWWLEELAAIAPPSWRAGLSSRPRVWLEPRREGGWRLLRDGRPLAGGLRSIPTGSRIGLLLPPEAILLREITVPRMSASDVRQLVALDIDRISPLAPELIHFDTAIAERGDGAGVQRVDVAIVAQQTVAELLERARRDGLAPVALAAAAPSPEAPPRFDFLPQALEGAAPRAGMNVRRYLWAAVIALILLNIGILVGRDMISVSRLRDAVEAQRPGVEAVQRLRRRVQTEEVNRRALIARGQQNDPLRVLNLLTQAIPRSAFIQRMEWNGHTLHITGFKRDDTDMAAAVRGSGAFANPKLLPAGPAAATGLKPFDLTADARQEPRP